MTDVRLHHFHDEHGLPVGGHADAPGLHVDFAEIRPQTILSVVLRRLEHEEITDAKAKENHDVIAHLGAAIDLLERKDRRRGIAPPLPDAPDAIPVAYQRKKVEVEAFRVSELLHAYHLAGAGDVQALADHHVPVWLMGAVGQRKVKMFTRHVAVNTAGGDQRADADHWLIHHPDDSIEVLGDFQFRVHYEAI